jgi:ABC-type uncharacterized transport system permease subunit
MFESIVIINFCLPLLYLVAFVLYITEFFKNDFALLRAKRYALAAVSVIHFMYLGLLTFFYGSLPIANVYQLMTTIAFTLVVVYLFIELSTGESSTGSFMLLAALTFQSISSLFLFSASPAALSVSSPLLSLHIITEILGYSAVAIAGVYSSLYMVLLRQIQANRFGTLFDRLPNLETLENESTCSAIWIYLSQFCVHCWGAVDSKFARTVSFYRCKTYRTYHGLVDLRNKPTFKGTLGLARSAYGCLAHARLLVFVSFYDGAELVLTALSQS